MDNIKRLSNEISVSINPDEDGFTGRECPEPDCEGYFKIIFGTGLQGENLPCYCPYCGHSAPHDHFWTKEQIEYAESVAARQITDTFYKDLKKLEFNYKPKGAFGIGVSLVVDKGKSIPICHYREKRLETEVLCSNCTLHYSVYGVFAYCPDCGQHNSLQILEKNIEVVVKMLSLSSKDELSDVRESFLANALENTVSAFDGFGRELCRLYSDKASNPAKARKISFQNLSICDEKLMTLFEFSLSSLISAEQWQFANQCFQKRHLFAHAMGVIDQKYLDTTDDQNAVLGRKATISADEISQLNRIILALGKSLSDRISNL